MSQTITEFLEARITEDEYEAEVCLAQYRRGEGGSSRRWVRQLAECAAKRAIIAAHPIVDNVVEVSTRVKWGFACETCFSYGDLVEDHGYCDTLRALAAVYADHPEYNKDWS